MAEQFRRTNCDVYYINGFTSERMNSIPINAKQHPDSYQLAEGWIFPDGSEIWETATGNVYTINTSK